MQFEEKNKKKKNEKQIRAGVKIINKKIRISILFLILIQRILGIRVYYYYYSF
jgi:hypothetical protein